MRVVTWLLVSLMLNVSSVWGSLFSKCSQQDGIVNCTHTGLTEIPQNLGEIEVLDLSGNQLTVIETVDIEGLQTLNLSDNTIINIHNSAFSHLDSLRSLDLSGNRLTGDSLREAVFEGLNSLASLNLERNPLQRIRKDTFDFMTLLDVQYLDLSHCQISEIESYGIHLPSLKYLDLRWNSLESFNDEMIHGLTSLVTLDLSHNHIRVLDEIPIMPSLETWILDSNGIEKLHIQTDLEYRAENLKNLYLR